MSSANKFPSPVGGVAFPSDFAPSVIFAAMYGLLLPLLGYRMFNSKSRTVMLGGSLAYGVERIIVFSLRAVESRTPSMRKETEVNAYFQLTFAIGSTIICMDVVNLLRAALVNTTLKSSRRKSEVPLSFEATSGSSTQTVSTFQVQEEYSAEEDKPSERYWYRRLSDLLSVGFFSALVLGVVASSLYSGATMMEHTTLVFRLRYASSAIALSALIALALTAGWASKNVSGFRKNAGYFTIFICGLFSITLIYRLVVMNNTTTSLASTAPGSLNTPGAKAAFYIFHIAPEWISVLLLLLFNLRDIFGIGVFGSRARDQRKSEKEAKGAKETHKYDGKAGQSIGIHDEDFGLFSKTRKAGG